MGNSFLYPRKISVRRPNAEAGFGPRPYGGVSAANETVIATNLPAHVQPDNRGRAPAAGLPAAATASYWKVILPKAARNFVREHDVVVDEDGNRFQVVTAAWGPLVTTCLVQDSET